MITIFLIRYIFIGIITALIIVYIDKTFLGEACSIIIFWPIWFWHGLCLLVKLFKKEE